MKYKKWVLILIVIFSIQLFAKRAPITSFFYPDKYENYNFSDWNTIKGKLTINVLRGNEIDTIENNISTANSLLARIARMELTNDERHIIRTYLIQFLDNYLNNRRFIEYINSNEFMNPRNDIGTRPDTFLEAPQNIIRTVAVLNPTQAEADHCVKAIKKLNNKRVEGQYLLHLLHCILLFSKDNTAEKHLVNIDFSVYSKYTKERAEDFKLLSMVKSAGSQEKAWLLLLNEYHKLLKSDKREKRLISIFLDQSWRIIDSIYKSPDYKIPLEYLENTQDIYDEYFWGYQLNGIGYLYISRVEKSPENLKDLQVICSAVKGVVGSGKKISTKQIKDFDNSLPNQYESLINQVQEKYGKAIEIR